MPTPTRRRSAPRRRNPSYDDLRLYRNVLTGPEGSIRLRKIGKGAFSVAYVEERTDTVRPRVFVFSDDGVYDKELLAMAHESAPSNPHLPAVERYGSTATQSVYTMPLYKAPLRKDDDTVGWRDYLALKKCRDEAYAPAYGGPRNRGKTGYEINEDVYACAEAKGVRPSLLEALRALIDTASNYGEAYVFEFSPRNLATHEGRLVLLDVLYDRDVLQRRQTQARQKRGLMWTPKTLRRNPVPARIRSTRKNPVINLSEFDASKGFHDVQDAVFRYAPEEDFYADEFNARDEHALDILAKHGIDTERRPLGKGAMARVYALDGDPHWVVKITSDPTDAALMAEAQFAGPFAGTPGIPKVASVFDLGPTPVRPDKFPGPLFAIVVERLMPLTQQDKLKVRALAKTYQRGWLADPAVVRDMLKKVAKGSVEEAWLRGVLFVYAMGFRPTDLHANNIMRRDDGTYAFSDFGVSGAEGRTASRDIPSLDGPAPKKKVRRTTRKAAPAASEATISRDLVATSPK